MLCVERRGSEVPEARAGRVDNKTMGPGGFELPEDTVYTAIVKGAPNMVLQYPGAVDLSPFCMEYDVSACRSVAA